MCADDPWRFIFRIVLYTFEKEADISEPPLTNVLTSEMLRKVFDEGLEDCIVVLIADMHQRLLEEGHVWLHRGEIETKGVFAEDIMKILPLRVQIVVLR